MEKRRRDRINQSLETLRLLLAENTCNEVCSELHVKCINVQFFSSHVKCLCPNISVDIKQYLCILHFKETEEPQSGKS